LEAESDAYLGPVKFAAIAIAIDNLLLPLLMSLGAAVGAVSQDYAAFYEMAREQGVLGPPEWTGVELIDRLFLEVLKLATFYLLGALMWALSGRKIPVRFAAGYYFYVNAWTLLGSLLDLAFMIVAVIVPLYATGLPQLVQIGVGLAFLFMMLGFPILFWSKMLETKRLPVAIGVGGGFLVWVAAVAIVLTNIMPMPGIAM
jgi:hypothetical protein